MKIAACQLNPVVGDIEGNLAKISETLNKYKADLYVFPELFITGYPPLDLLERKEFILSVQEAVEKLRKISPEKGILVGAPMPSSKKLYNSALLIHKGKVFQQNKLTIFPVQNGEYILFHDPENKSYFKFSSHGYERQPEVH